MHFPVIALVEASGYSRSASKPRLYLAAEKASRRQRQRRDERLHQQAELYDLHESLDKRIVNELHFRPTLLHGDVAVESSLSSVHLRNFSLTQLE